MFLSVTPNAVVDKTIFIEEFRPGTYMQASHSFFSVGGKALCASVALRHLGQETVGLHCAAGRTGQDLQALLEAYGIRPEPVWVGGETRTAHILAESAARRHSHIFTGGLLVSEEHTGAMLARFNALLPAARYVLTGGRLPPGMQPDFFLRLTRLAADAGVPTLVDSWNEPLLECLPARPAVVKMNREEFAQSFGMAPASLEELAQSARGVLERWQLPALVVTWGEQGLLAVTPQGTFHARPPAQIVVSAAGAGDAASGALAWRLAEGDPWPQALRWAAAVSAASVLTEGTSDLHMEDVHRILPEVEVNEF